MNSVLPRPTFVSLAAFVVLGAAGDAWADGSSEAPRKPAPAWVDSAQVDTAYAPPAEHGVTEFLSDEQIRLDRGTRQDYRRRVFRFESQAGVESSSELHFTFEPSYEHLALHHLRILRGGQTIDALAHADWQVIQPERDREVRQYNGELEGLLFLHDVRAGDIVDCAYSVEGVSPIAGGRFAERLVLAQGVPLGHLRRRIVVADGRSLSFKAHGAPDPSESSEGAMHTYVWDRRDVPAAVYEDDLPGWYVPLPWVDATEFGTWQDVVGAIAPLFPNDAPDDAIRALADGWKAQFPTEAERALAATTFVQDEVRYLGVEIGPHTHQPYAPATVLGRRFGDCKDKSFLLVTFLRALGVQADVALVNTSERRTLDERLPSPFAFDHAIVRAVIDGTTQWIDATASYQRGPIRSRSAPPFERALVLAPDTKGLQVMFVLPPNTSSEDVDETYTVPAAADAAVSLQVVTTYRNDEAGEMRARIARSPKSEIARDYLNYYARQFPKVTAAGELSIDDDTTANVIVVREAYAIPDFLQDDGRDLWPEAIDKHLDRPRIVRRTMPLGIDQPRKVTHHTHLVLSDASAFKAWTREILDEAIAFHAVQSVQKNIVTVDYTLEAFADSVPAEKVADHLAKIDEIRDATSLHLDDEKIHGDPAKKAKDREVDEVVYGTLALLGLYVSWILGKIAIGYFKDLRLVLRRKAFRRRASLGTGDSAFDPLVVRDRREVTDRVAKARCACRAPLSPSPDGEETVRAGEMLVQVVRAACDRCGTARRVYFRLQG
jgi:transglutaminase-like putative cysteine protease